jgi:N-acetylneuraminic acid mutarotase
MKNNYKITTLLLGLCLLLVISVKAQTIAWQPKQPLGDDVPSRHSAGMTSLNGKLYITGGYSRSGGADFVHDFVEYDPATGAVRNLTPPVPSNPTTNVLVTVNNKIYYLIGSGFTEYNFATDTWTTKTASSNISVSSEGSAFVIGNEIFVFSEYGNRTFEAYNVITDTWSVKANYPGSAIRGSAIAFSIDGKGYFGGGCSSSNTTTACFMQDFYEYNPVTNTWTAKANLPFPFRNGVSYGHNGKGYAGLGLKYENSTSDVLMNNWYEYDPASNTWTTKSSSPYTAAAPAVAKINNDIYVFGGRGANKTINQTYNFLLKYNIPGNAWTTKETIMGQNRMQASGFNINNKIYVGGGHDGQPVNDFWEYDMTTNAWTAKASIPSLYVQRAAVAVNGKGYLIGGYLKDYSKFTDTLLEYNPATNSWTGKASFPGSKRGQMSTFVINGKIYAGLGWHNTAPAVKSDFYKYDPATNAWTAIANCPVTGSQNCSAFSIGGIGYIFEHNLYNAGGFLHAYDPATNTWTTKAPQPLSNLNDVSTNQAFTYNGKAYIYSSDRMFEYNPVTDSWATLSTPPVNKSKATVIGTSTGAYIGFGVTKRNNLSSYKTTNDWWEIAITSSPVNYWSGASSANWNDAGNWTLGVPTATSDITLNSGLSRYPALNSGTANVNNLTIANGTSLLLNGGTFNITGNLTNNGTFSASGGTVSFNGSTQQTISGSNASTFNNLTVGSAGVSLGAAASVKQLLTLNGNLITNGRTFTLLSDASGTAMVVNSGGVVNGITKVQRYINPSLNAGSGYRHFASPVTNTTIADLATSGFTPVVNPAYNTAAIPSILKPFPTIFQYNQARLTNDSAATMDFGFGWESPAAISSTLIPGKGYTINIPASRTVDFTGALNNGTVTVTNLNKGATTNSGWHLLGNPYPSPIDWDNISRPSGIMNAVYTFRSSSAYNGSYASYVNGVGSLTGGIIPAMQGFFVRTTGNVSSFSFTNAARLTSYTNPSFYRTSETRPLLQLSAQNGQHSDDTYLYQEQGATAGVDNAYDAFSLPMGQVRIYTTAGPEALAINGLDLKTQLVPLVIAGPAGNYTLKVEQLLNQFHVALEDKQLNTIQSLTPNSNFTFSHSGGTSGNRFLLHLNGSKKAMVNEEKGMELKLFPNPSQGQFQFELSGIETDKALLTITDITGKVMQQQEVKATNGSISETVNLKAAKGIYLLQVKADSQTFIRKVVVE